MRWRFQHALGVCCSLWHSSQAAELSEASREEVLTFCGPLSKSERTALLGALEAVAIVSRLENGAFRIHGNEHHITAKKVNSIAQRNRALERWKKLGVSDAGGIENGYRRHTGADARSERSGSERIRAERIGSPKPPPAPALPEGEPPLALIEEASREAEDRPMLSVADPIETTLDAIAAKVPADQAKAIVDYYRQLSTEKRHLAHPPMILPREMMAARMIVAMAAGDLAVAKRAIFAYVTSNENDYWKKQGWPIAMIGRPRDFEQAVAIVSKPKNTTKAVTA